MEKGHDGRKGLGWTDIIAGVILLLGLLRVFKVDDFASRLDNTTLLYLCASGAVFLLKNAKSFKFGDLQIELEQIRVDLREAREEVKEAKLLAGIAEDASKVGIFVPEHAKVSRELFAVSKDIVPGEYSDDPWKGVFGGKSISRDPGRELTASVYPFKDSPGWYSVELIAASLPGSVPLEGDVQFFLHSTFPNNKPIVQAVKGSATLRLKAWGAFTVGVLSDNGNTKLELDLAELPTAPMEFRSR